MTIIQTYNIYVRKELRIRDYFWKPKCIREQHSLGNTGIYETCRNWSTELLLVPHGTT